ncbi:MAG: hypothetical protein WC606_01740 [Candidatus Absconditabacterales bacterium]
MLSKSKKLKLLTNLKVYVRKFLNNKITELDESGTRLMINDFLSNVLGYIPIEEIKTEYMIRGTYADYVIQIKGVQHFLIEVKSLSLQLSDKHLRQATNYGANEGIERVLLTNGRNFDFYKIIFSKPIEVRKIFSVNLTDNEKLKENVEFIEFLCRDVILNKGLDLLWNKTVALNPEYIAGYLYDPCVINFIKRNLKKKFKTSFSDEEIHNSINRIVTDAIPIEKVKIIRTKKETKKAKNTGDVPTLDQIVNTNESSLVNCA